MEIDALQSLKTESLLHNGADEITIAFKTVTPERFKQLYATDFSTAIKAVEKLISQRNLARNITPRVILQLNSDAGTLEEIKHFVDLGARLGVNRLAILESREHEELPRITATSEDQIKKTVEYARSIGMPLDIQH